MSDLGTPRALYGVMVSAPRMHEQTRPVVSEDDMSPRRPATTAALDARLSVWGHAAREAAHRRAEALIEGALLYVERVGRNAEVLKTRELAGAPLILSDADSLIALGANTLPSVVVQSCRLLWVDPDRLREKMEAALQPEIEAARSEIRRLQALYRRRARLWQTDQARLDRLREDIEDLRVPRCPKNSAAAIAKGLLLRHREDAGFEAVPPTQDDSPRLRVSAGHITRWILQIEQQLGAPELRLAH